jgi:hypothetical protein
MAHTPTIGVYTHSYSAKNPTPAQQQALLAEAELLGDSDFNLIMLASLHVHDDGTIYYGDTPMISGGQPSGELAANLATCIRKMKGSASDGTVLASFGGGGMFKGEAVGWYDFTHIQTLIDKYPNPADNPFFQNLACLFSTYPIDGFDIDLESYQGYDAFTPTLITIIEWLRNKGRMATLCPYDAPDFWCNVVNKTQSGGAPTIAWVNLQNASGTLPEFVTQLGKVGVGLGGIVGGLQVNSMTTGEVTSYFQAIASGYPGIGGGWLWDLETFGLPNTMAYATAVGAGLAQSGSERAA